MTLAPAAAPETRPPLNEDQQFALDRIVDWLHDSSSPFFVLSGSAGTGKTFCIRQLVDATRGRFIFTAPTNKATKVLRASVTSRDYKPECRTIYSLLGLRLEASGEVKELVAPEDPIDLSQYKLVVVDEGSMVNAILMKYIKLTVDNFGIKFLFMGDPAQLPPVGELRSPIWTIDQRASLTKVMRHDNQILELATRLRGVVDHPAPSCKLESNHDGEEGVWKVSEGQFESVILRAADAGLFSKPDMAKAIAWRNVSVDRLNKLIRDRIFDKPSTPWLPGDRAIFTSPAKDLEDEVIATTDDEGTVERVEVEWHGAYPDFKIFRVSITLDTNSPVIARVLHPDSQHAYSQRLDDLSTAAKLDRRKWKAFWEFKDAFHQLRHSYAITAHRAQGSTYDTAFVDWRDILLNRNRQEAFRCLYVACTRPKRRLFLG